MSDKLYNKNSEFESISDSDKSDKSEYDNNTTEILTTDENGFIIPYPGQKLGSFKVNSVLGEGAFGRVLHVTNQQTRQNAALKVGKNDPKDRKTAMAEIIALTLISCYDPNNNSLCIKMLSWFNYNGHMCIAFPVLGQSVFDFMKDNGYVPFAMNQVRHISYQLCRAVSFLHENRMTHTDLKPENILFVNSKYTTELNADRKVIRRIICTDIRLSDFGSVTREHEHHNTIVTTTYYRAPEVTLQLGWSYPIDVWSIGCTIFEIYTGYSIFPANTDRKRLIMFQETLGPIPLRMASKSKKWNGQLNFTLNEEEKEWAKHNKPLNEFPLCNCDDDNVLFDLIKQMLAYEPVYRITLKKALMHSYFHK